jgi:uncharacterized protein (DUF3084 family)
LKLETSDKPNEDDIEKPDVKEEVQLPIRQEQGVDTNGRLESREDSDAEDEEAQNESVATTAPTQASSTSEMNTDDTKARLDALANEREALREEVASLRQSLEAFQGGAEQGSHDLQQQLEEAKEGKAQAEANYQKLMGRVNQIKQTLGDRLRADAVCVLRCDRM